MLNIMTWVKVYNIQTVTELKQVYVELISSLQKQQGKILHNW